MSLDQYLPVLPQCAECGSVEMDSFDDVYKGTLCWKCKMAKQKAAWAKYESSPKCDNCKKESVVNSDFICRACCESGYYIKGKNRKCRNCKRKGKNMALSDGLCWRCLP